MNQGKTLTLMSLILILSLNSIGQHLKTIFNKNTPMPMGIYYYPEHWNKSEWERDIRNISEIGFKFIHLAEFSWIELEPSEGKFNFEWLDEVVKIAQKYNLKVIMCTPTASLPIWMGEKYPDIYWKDANYQRAAHGTRGLGSIYNNDFNSFTQKIVTELAKRYGQNPNIWGWQLDNEPDAKPDYSESAQEAFRLWLKSKYKNISELNIAWGSQFWSQTYFEFDKIRIPNAQIVGWWGTNPHALLDFKRFSADKQAEYLDMQAKIIRQYALKDQFITTNYTAWSNVSDPRRTNYLDFPAYTIYPNWGSDNLGENGFRLGDGRYMSFASDFQRGYNGITGVLELQPGQTNWGDINPMLLPGTLRMWLYHSYASGCSFACSYRYRQINYGCEQFHGAVTKLDGETLSEGGKDYKQTIKEFEILKSNLIEKPKYPQILLERKAAVLWNYDNYWSLERQKQNKYWDTRDFFFNYLDVLKSLGAPTDIVYENQDLSQYNFVIAPAYEILDSLTINKWQKYVSNGGNLILTFRTGMKNKNGHLYKSSVDSKMTNLIGATVENYDQLPSSKQATVFYKQKTYNWFKWGEILKENDKTKVLATYSNQFYSSSTAAVQNKIGKGTVTYIGLESINFELEKQIIKDIYESKGVKTEDYPLGIYVQWRDGFWIAVNYTSKDYALNIPNNAKIIIGDKILKSPGVTVWKE